MVGDARAVKLGKRAVDAGWRLEHSPAGYRLTDANTGTLVAADWTAPGGYGIDLDLVEAVLDGTYVDVERAPVGKVTATEADAIPELTVAEMNDELPPAVRKLTRAVPRRT